MACFINFTTSFLRHNNGQCRSLWRAFIEAYIALYDVVKRCRNFIIQGTGYLKLCPNLGASCPGWVVRGRVFSGRVVRGRADVVPKAATLSKLTPPAPGFPIKELLSRADATRHQRSNGVWCSIHSSHAQGIGKEILFVFFEESVFHANASLTVTINIFDAENW